MLACELPAFRQLPQPMALQVSGAQSKISVIKRQLAATPLRFAARRSGKLLHLIQRLRGIFHRGSGPDRLEIRILLLLMNIDGLKKQGPAIHVYIETSQFPVPLANVLLLDKKSSACGQVSQYSAAELHFARQVAINSGDPLLPRVHPD